MWRERERERMRWVDGKRPREVDRNKGREKERSC
jgi:hypothetical protein